ncbi:MAG: hypothetical protein DLM63_01740 [Solirubrobacterales bacterium]|nr:MAG: hypothetical protein DLM63_01740 [Solirubrobacterales bacterium]
MADRGRDLLGELAGGDHATGKDRAALGELALVARGVGARGDDQQRVARRGRPVGVEHDTGLGGIGGSGDERQGHDPIVAGAPDAP